jgi:acid phosphatase type 7
MRLESVMRRAALGALWVILILAVVAGGGTPGQAQEPGGYRVYLPVLLSGALLPEPGPAPTPTATTTPTSSPAPTPTRMPAPAGNCTGTSGFDQVHLAWRDEPSTTLTVVWRTLDTAAQSRVQFRPVGDVPWQIATGAERTSGTTGKLHEATLTGLAPGTAYEYCVEGDNEGWSTPFFARTAPVPGLPAGFSVIYVADTGLVGRTDGLATGTQQVIAEIAKLKPDVILGGGDYAYFDSDKRYGTYEKSIDAWFNQMQEAIAYAPFMSTYGNHEYELDNESADGVQPWANRLPTPAGFMIGSQLNFSFDMGDVHFVALFAASDRRGVSSETLEWFEGDVLAAKERGMRWIIAYYHVTPFGDGTNHGPNLLVRGDVGPLFERMGVQIAIASHDHAYERSFPLVDVPATNTPTSSSLSCYTQQDGTTYVKVSPGGKMSNISGGFSPFASSTTPDWTAARDNTMHHFARLVFSADGSVTFEAWGVKGDGSAPVILDTFKYTMGSCP